MSTQDTAIVIGDDDDDSEEEVEAGVDRIRAILPEVSVSEARKALEVANGNVEHAMDQLLLLMSVPEAAPTEIRKADDNKSWGRRDDDDDDDERGRSLVCGFKRRRRRSDASSSSEDHHGARVVSGAEEELSEEWHRCASSLRNGQDVFVDSAFPPCSRSIDGRNRTTNQPVDVPPPMGEASTGRRARRPGTVLCRCGVPAAARTVQSDGPNYGRFYLACGICTRLLRTSRQARPDVASTPSAAAPAQCNFFQWDPHGSLGAANQDGGSAEATAAHASATTTMHQLEWVRFDPTLQNCRMVVPKGPSPDHVRQGRLGNCWFLSALAVVAERPDLIRRIVPHDSLNNWGCYQINLCLDGRWTPVIADAYLPVVMNVDGEAARNGRAEGRRQGARRTGRPSDGIVLSNGRVAHGAFCAFVSRQLWPALVEKAYAKAHTCYRNLSGGFIAEALHDLTGAPTETTVFATCAVTADERDELWARLVSFREAGFVMGVATASGGEGLVGGHAYSILDVIEVHDSIEGEQCKVTDFFAVNKSNPRSKAADGAHLDKSRQPMGRKRGERATIRLVRIRNPWGTREWKGAWSADSDRWTLALRKRLQGSWSKGDGTFFMSYDDMLDRFHHLDVAKVRTGWHFESTGGTFQIAGSTGVESSDSIVRIRATERAWAYLSIIQPKKRANTTSRYYYCDPSFLLLKRKRDSSDSWICETAVLCGIQRISSCEVFLDPEYSYACVPFSGLSILKGPYPYRVACYSASTVEMTSDPNVQELSTAFTTALHKELLTTEGKDVHRVSASCLLIVIHGDGCLFFMALNGSSDSVLSLRLVLEDSSGFVQLLGKSDDTHFIGPERQRLLASVSRTGGTSGSSRLNFRYAIETVPSGMGSRENRENGDRIDIAGTSKDAPIPIAGDLLFKRFENVEAAEKGSHSVEMDFSDWSLSEWLKS